MKRVFWSLAIVTLVVFIAGAAFAFIVASRVDTLPDSEVESLAPIAADVPRTILLVGSDSREGIPDDFADVFGNFGGERADVIMIAHIAGGQAQLLSIPRDLKVQIPGRGTDKINAAFAYGGPDLLIETVTLATGIPINHYVEIGFGGFAKLVDAVGGVTIDFPYPARDAKSGLSVEAGPQRLGGEMALAYVRSRSYEELRDGSWRSVDASDIGRAGRQQKVLGAILEQMDSPVELLRLPRFATTLADALTTDSGFNLKVMTGLAVELGRSRDLDSATLPVQISNEGGVSYVIPTAEAPGVIEAFMAGELIGG